MTKLFIFKQGAICPYNEKQNFVVGYLIWSTTFFKIIMPWPRTLVAASNRSKVHIPSPSCNLWPALDALGFYGCKPAVSTSGPVHILILVAVVVLRSLDNGGILNVSSLFTVGIFSRGHHCRSLHWKYSEKRRNIWKHETRLASVLLKRLAKGRLKRSSLLDLRQQ